MPDHTAVVPSIMEQDAARVEDRSRLLPAACALIEIRADLLSAADLTRVVQQCDRRLIVTVRMERDGGLFQGTESERDQLLMAGLHAGATFVDLEIDSRAAARGLIPRQRLVLSWHGDSGRSDPLPAILSRMTTLGAAFYKLVPHVSRAGELALVRDFLKATPAAGPAVICVAAGRQGALSRILAPSWGSRWTIGSPPGGRATGEGQFPVADLLEIYDVDTIGADTRIFGLIGKELAGSPSPAMHNAAFRNLGIDARYLPMEINHFQDLKDLTDPDGPIGVSGYGVTMPFKEAAFGLAVDLDRPARAAGAVNTLVSGPGGWHGRNTDAVAIRTLVDSVLPARRRRVLIHGAGGTARTAAAVFRESGDQVTMVGRNAKRVRQVAEEIGVGAAADWDEAGAADILVNATPEGRDGALWPPGRLLPAELVLDAPYGSRETDLVLKARRCGLEVVSGREWILAQAEEQFRLLTGRQAPGTVMAEALGRWFAMDPA